jgi:hypothetical protein
MKAATAKSKILSNERTIAGFTDLIYHMRDRIQSFCKVLIAELLCATSCEIA